LRNAIFSVIPKAVTDKVYKASQQKIIGEASDFNKKVKSVFAAFKKNHDQEQEAVLKIVGKTKIEQLTNDDLVTLIGVGQALKDGDTTIEIVFKTKEKSADEKKADLKARQDAEKEKQPETKPEETKEPTGQEKANEAQGTDLFNAKEMP